MILIESLVFGEEGAADKTCEKTRKIGMIRRQKMWYNRKMCYNRKSYRKKSKNRVIKTYWGREKNG